MGIILTADLLAAYGKRGFSPDEAALWAQAGVGAGLASIAREQGLSADSDDVRTVFGTTLTTSVIKARLASGETLTQIAAKLRRGRKSAATRAVNDALAAAVRSALGDGVDPDRAWRMGRRIYVRAGYQTALHDGMRSIGATWDADRKAWWVGIAKRDAVVALVLAQQQLRTDYEQRREAGVEVRIPYDAGDVRSAAKAAGALWVADRKVWSIPADRADEIAAMVTAWRREADIAEAADKARTAERAAASVMPEALASPAQVDYIMKLLARRHGDDSGFMVGPTTRAGVAAMSRSDASIYIASLKGDY